MPKAKFRSRKIDDRRPLPVYRASEILDFDEIANIQRSVPQVETGVEKEEEEEHHLQAAISASKAGQTGETASVYIPTPDASKQIQGYEHFYEHKFHQPSTFIRFSANVEDSTGCPYNIDEMDEEWLRSYNQNVSEEKKLLEDQFENVMYIFETAANDKYNSAIPTYEDMVAFLINSPLAYPGTSDLHSASSLVYEHWRQRRIASDGQSITPLLKVSEVVSESDPYVCFRKREAKSTRKTRRTDAQSHEKLTNLRHELHMVKELLYEVCSREKMRKESMVLERLVFDQLCLVREQRRLTGFVEGVDEGHPVHKKNYKGDSNEPRSFIPKSIHSGLSTPQRKPGVVDDTGSSRPKPKKIFNQIGKNLKLVGELLKRKEAMHSWIDTTESLYQLLPEPQSSYFRSSSNHHHGLFRCRVGRGGRVFVDRRRSHTQRHSQETLQKYKYDADDDDPEYSNFDNIYDRLLHCTRLYTGSISKFSTSVNAPNSTALFSASLNTSHLKRASGLKPNTVGSKGNPGMFHRNSIPKGVKPELPTYINMYGKSMNGSPSKMSKNSIQYQPNELCGLPNEPTSFPSSPRQ